MKNFKSHVTDMFWMLLISLPAFLAPLEAHAKKPITPIKAVGFTQDGKYKVYDLQGEIDDDVFFSSKEVAYRSGDLVGRMEFLDPKDVGKGYVCEFICKDGAGRIVGINPNFKWMLDKK